MPNKQWEMGVDMIPNTTNTFNLGTSQKKWIFNGYQLGDACAKGVDTSISDSTTSTDVPTTLAVKNFVDSKATTVTVVGKKLVINPVESGGNE